jgi:hypothetical protein
VISLGIVGHEAAKFTMASEVEARRLIRWLISSARVRTDAVEVVSGACPLGGIDVWAIEEARRMEGIGWKEFPPATDSWTSGYKPRNIQIAERATIVHNLVVQALPSDYRGMRFSECYHCHTTDHVKSGGCWTAKYAQRLGKPAKWWVIV